MVRLESAPGHSRRYCHVRPHVRFSQQRTQPEVGKATPPAPRGHDPSARSCRRRCRARSDPRTTICGAVACVMLAACQSVSEARQKSRRRSGTVRAPAMDAGGGFGTDCQRGRLKPSKQWRSCAQLVAILDKREQAVGALATTTAALAVGAKAVLAGNLAGQLPSADVEGRPSPRPRIARPLY
jgi:hypothetical protein